MMLWFRLALVCWLLVCVLLSLTLPVGLNHPLQVVESEPWLAPARECAAHWPPASVVRSMEFDPARSGPLASLVLDGAWTAGNLDPPAWRPMGHRNRSGLGKLPVKPATPTNALEHPFSTKYWLKPPILKNQGLATAFS